MQLTHHIILNIFIFKGEVMSIERLLNKKIERLNTLKSKLVSRSDESKEEIIEGIRDTVDDLEIILEDSKISGERRIREE